ncbi:MAG: C_GCAxxG_C_C family protein [Deltaproteobacteria bacterium]|nr:C_GCAxxG_C_C family protein [Candidatus Zymogenaceae bacterium]
MHRTNTAVAAFSEGFSCSQAVLSAFSEEPGLDRATALKISTAFGGGMASLGLTCEAVMGALMVIGLKNGGTGMAEAADILDQII